MLRGGMGMCVTRYIHEHHPEIQVIQDVLFRMPMWSTETCRVFGKCWGSTAIRCSNGSLKNIGSDAWNMIRTVSIAKIEKENKDHEGTFGCTVW